MAYNSEIEVNDTFPRVEDLTALLDDVEQEASLEGVEVDTGELDGDLSAEEEGYLFGEGEGGSLEQLLDIASRYPGLKITLSF
jgi:hypothetical protein